MDTNESIPPTDDGLGPTMSNHDDTTGAADAADEGFGNIDFDADINALLADPSMWESPDDGLGDRIVTAIASESTLGPGAMSAASASASRRAWLRPALLGAAAAIVVLFGGIVVLSALSGVDDVDSFSAELVSTGLINDQSGDITVTEFDSGLQIELDAASLPRRDNGAFYEGWVKTVDGNLFPVGTFHDGVDVILWAGVGLDRVELFTITLEEDAPGADPGQASSGEVVLRAEINP